MTFKFNLKNRPETSLGMMTSFASSSRNCFGAELCFLASTHGFNEVKLRKCGEWFEGFEKQIESKRNFLLAHQLETNMAKSHDWNIGYNYGLNKAIDLCRELLGEGVEAKTTP